MANQTPGEFYAAETISRAFFCVVVMWAVHVLRTPDSSQLLTCGAALHVLSLVAIVLGASRGQLPASSPGATLLMSAALALRLASTTYFQGYLPVDSSGDGPYQVLELTQLVLALKVVAYFVARGKEPLNYRPALSAATAAALWASLCYGELNKNPIFDRIYAMSLYVELVSVGFQTLHFCSREAAESPYAFLVPQALGFLCRLRFWLSAGDEVSPMRPVRLQEYFPRCLLGCAALGALFYAAVALRRAAEPPAEEKPKQVTVGPLPADIPGITLPADNKLVPLSAVYTAPFVRVTYRPSAE